MTGGSLVLKLRSLNIGTRKNSQMCMQITDTNWKIILPIRFLRRYSARSTMIKTNCSSNMIKNAIGILFSCRYDVTPPSPCVDCKCVRNVRN